MDFTIQEYRKLLHTLKKQGYAFQTFEEFLRKPTKKVILLRHDVDLLPENSLQFAKIQLELGVKGSYYFRAVPESWDEKIVLEIAEMGHEIGYHYETMDTAKGNVDIAMDQFKQHLKSFRKLVKVNTICMHGSPLSKYDNKEIWEKYNYKEFGIIGEPYYDINYNQVYYLTDTGRKWDGYNVSVRDKVKTSFKQTFHTTDQIIKASNNKELPDQVMFTFHPQRWHDDYFSWTTELIGQNIKNIIKKIFYVKT